MSFAISAEKIQKVFGKGKKAVEALKGVDLSIEQGELFFLLGGSGCGKTTLLRCIAGLEEYDDRGIDQMSGGQQQRVSLARALVVKPKCLLLDEPLSNLDAALRLKMRAEIRRIVKENNLTGVYVTHDQEEALSMADRMAVMDMGEIVQVGTPPEIYQNPKTSYVAGFIGETNILKGVVKELGETITLETWAGLLKGRKSDVAWLPEVEQEVLMSIRPEALRVVTSGDESGVLRAKVRESTYLGDTIQYGMELCGELGHQDEKLVQVSEVNPKELRQVSDQEVWLAVDESDVVILEK